MKGSEPLPYTADEIMDLVDRYCTMLTSPKIFVPVGMPSKMHSELQAIAERYEYMNLHFNPAKSLILSDDEYDHPDPPVLIVGEEPKDGFPYCDPDKKGI